MQNKLTKTEQRMLIGYARVSTEEENLSLQRFALVELHQDARAIFLTLQIVQNEKRFDQTLTLLKGLRQGTLAGKGEQLAAEQRSRRLVKLQ